jgi:hypothetical protein
MMVVVKALDERSPDMSGSRVGLNSIKAHFAY